jgi:hypothetical protein
LTPAPSRKSVETSSVQWYSFSEKSTVWPEGGKTLSRTWIFSSKMCRSLTLSFRNIGRIKSRLPRHWWPSVTKMLSPLKHLALALEDEHNPGLLLFFFLQERWPLLVEALALAKVIEFGRQDRLAVLRLASDYETLIGEEVDLDLDHIANLPSAGA